MSRKGPQLVRPRTTPPEERIRVPAVRAILWGWRVVRGAVVGGGGKELGGEVWGRGGGGQGEGTL